ncbi:MAG: penicillin-binding protein 2 [Alphaproteobacteria bacterium]|nr:penicillin-binding protein 2 [Alphaproteobacteria bacterium]
MPSWKDKDQDRGKLFGRRAALLAGGQLLLLSTLVGRMYYLQVVESAKYQKLAEDNRINFRLLAPPRGVIYDRHGEVLAHNQQNYRVVVVPEQISDVTLALDALSEVIEVPAFVRRRVMREIRRKRSFVPVTVRDNLSWEEVSRIELNATSLPGMQIEVGLTRAYPFGPAVVHAVGYVAAVSEQDLTGEPLLELPDVRIGKSGIERQHDQALRGTAGTSQVEVNALGRVIRELSRDEGRPGKAVTLTLDMGLQSFANARLASQESATAVVLGIPDGDVLALASHPSYDPVPFGRGLTSQEWQDLLRHPYGALNSKTIAGQYPPGSTFKPVVALAALESGMASSQRFFCPGHFELGDAKFFCYAFKTGGHGQVDMVEAIAKSCDCYFYNVALRIGMERISAMSRRLGLGAPTELDIPGERPGLVPSREWKKATTGESWQNGETVNLGIGQGYILTTPLQLAVMTARVATGLMIKPRLTRAVGGVPVDIDPPEPIGLSPQNLAVVQRGMDHVVNSPYGTARAAAIKEAAFRMAGKSGSAQVKRITQRDRDMKNTDSKKWEWRFRDHALFVSYAPVSAPRYVCAVVVEHGVGGSAVAAPICRDVLLEAQKRDIMRGGGVKVARAESL